MVEKHTLSVLVNNHMGVLSRVSGLFSRRGYSIESLSVGVTENKNLSRITIVVECDGDIANQIKNQLQKLVDVVMITECKAESSIRRELALIKISSSEESRSKIIEVANIFRCHIIDVSLDSLVIEATGDESKIDALLSLLKEFGVKEVIRTGVTAIKRGCEN